MSKVFVEYRVEESSREQYMRMIRERPGRFGEWELFEGADQRGLFVEIWHGLSRQQYERMKEDRTEGKAPLPWDRFVSGGPGKLHIWQFDKVR
jgi:hypothetical protein